MEGEGYLVVTVQPGASTDLDAFHNWYNTEHGPLRLRLPFIKTGDRFCAIDGAKPEWAAVYNVSDLAWLDKRIYTRLREERSAREKAVMKTFKSLDRKIYSLTSSHGDHYLPAPFQVSVSWRMRTSDLDELNRWYDEEHIGLLSKMPSWLGTRRYKLVVQEVQGKPQSDEVEILAVHQFQTREDFSGPEAKAAASTPWRNKIAEKALWAERREWEHHIEFEPLEEPPSTVITTDGAHLRFQLEGNPADPVVVCVNSILTNLHIWDDVSRALQAGVRGQTFRVLRYNARGYSQQDARSNATSFALLADDLEYLLQRMQIERAHAVLGVSMGGVTALAFAARHPQMLSKVVACDCNVASSAANSQAWAARVQYAREKGMEGLATATVERWFAPANHGSANAVKTRQMVLDANFEGFRLNSLALSDYDLRSQLAEIKAPTLLIAGEADGKIPEAMQQFEVPHATFRSIPNAGHLPFLENHDAFMEALAEFL